MADSAVSWDALTDRKVAIEFGIGSAVDSAHAAFATPGGEPDVRDGLVRSHESLEVISSMVQRLC